MVAKMTNKIKAIDIIKWVFKKIQTPAIILCAFLLILYRFDTLSIDLARLKMRQGELEHINKLFMRKERGDFGFQPYTILEPEFDNEQQAAEYYESLKLQNELVTEEIDAYLNDE
jgi:hypothetical protein